MTSFQHHLLEIKWRFFYVLFSAVCIFGICYNSPVEVIYLIAKPFLEFQRTFVFLDLTEAFYTLLKNSLIFTCVLSFPFCVFHVWSFYIPSLYKRERHTVTVSVLICLGILFFELGVCSFSVFPKICNFFLSFELTSPTSLSGNPTLTLEYAAQISGYVSFLLKLSFFLFVFFQIPLGVCFLFSQNLLDVSWFASNRKLLAFCSLLMSSFLVPPDVLIQFSVTVLFVIFSELMIFVGLFFQCSQKSESL